MQLAGDDEPERSALVADCQTNQGRGLSGSTGPARELGLDPLDCLVGRLLPGRPVGWLDLRCGSGKAWIEGAIVRAEGLDVEVVGVDLVGMFGSHDPASSCPQLVEATPTTRRPDRRFDRINCVHARHDVGDRKGRRRSSSHRGHP